MFAFLMFVGCTLISSITLGYGVYFSGLNETANYLETKIQYLAIGTAYNAFPNIRLAIRGDYAFRRAYLQLVDRLVRLDLNRTKLTERYYGNRMKPRPPVDRVPVTNRSSFWSKLRDIVVGRSGDVPEPLLDDLSRDERVERELSELEVRFALFADDREFFPQITCEIENVKGRLMNSVRKAVETELEVAGRRNGRSYFARRGREEIEELLGKINNWATYMSILGDIHLNETNILFERQKMTVSKLLDGFDLGKWFVGFDVLPPTPKLMEPEIPDGNFVQ
jgi:hypothetical protein